jgi:hypothetical protein
LADKYNFVNIILTDGGENASKHTDETKLKAVMLLIGTKIPT